MRRSAAVLTLAATGSLLGCGLFPTASRPPAEASPPPSDGSPAPASTGLLQGIGGQLKTAALNAKDSVTSGEKELEGKLEKPRLAVQQAVDEISPQDERAEGQAASFQVIRQNGGLLLDEPLTRYVNQVANLVGQQGSRVAGKRTGVARTRARRFVVGILKDSSLNAYSLPGGYLFVTRGLLEKLTCEADLAWVLGHEEAHVDLEHGLTALKAEVSTGAVLKELGVTGESSFQSEAFFTKIAGKLAELSMRPHSREEEEEADRLGLETSTAAGYDPQGAKRVLQILDAAGSKGGGGHADPHSRFEKLKPLIDAAPATRPLIGRARYDREAAVRLEAAVAAAAPPPTAGDQDWSK